MTDIVHVENLVKRYDDLIALDHFNLSIAPGEIFGLLGPNGSGKTTSINCILQLLAYDKGAIELFGEPMTPARYDLKRRIGVVPQQVAVFDELTVRENIDYFCSLYVNDRKRRRALVDEAIDFVGLGDFTKFRPGKLSGGLARRLNIACGIAHKPELIFFKQFTVHRLLCGFSGVDSALRKLPGVLTKSPGPHYLPLAITNHDTYVWAVAIVINHRTTSK